MPDRFDTLPQPDHDRGWRHDGPGAREFARAYLDHYDEVNAALDALVASHPVFAPVVAAISPAARREQERASRAQLAAAFEGRWAEYALPLRQQGAGYAAMGIRFTDWYDLAGGLTRVLTPILVRTYAHDAAVLTAALDAMQGFIDCAMAVLGQAYIDASEAQLRRRQRELERWEAIFRHVGWGVVVTDDDGAIEVANPAFAAMCGRDEDRAPPLAGTPFRALFAPGEAERGAEAFAEIQRAGRGSYEAVFVRADGGTFPVLVDAARVPSGDARRISWALNVHDLTERRHAEALRARSAELEAENRRVQEASRLKSEFLANMSHELRTPLNSIIGFSELLHLGEVGALEPKQHEFVGDILASGRHLLRLINDVLDLSKVEAGKLEFRPEALDLGAVLAEACGVLRGVSQERAVTIETEVEPGLDELVLDPSRFKQVLYNYLSNAVKFSPPGAVVRARACAAGAYAFRIEVTDHGPGIAPADLKRLFVEFEQLDASRAKSHGGTGLGLALTRRLVEAQGGTVGVESAVGRGSTFYAVLPRRAAGRATLPQPRRIPGVSSAAPRVLVVEDDPGDQERIVNTLVAAGYAVDTAATAAQARRALEDRAYDAITLDLLLPDGSGLEVLAARHASARHRDVPVVVISVVSERVTGGFVVHDVLAKPLHRDALLASLARAGVAPAGSSGPVLVVDDDEASARLMSEALEHVGFRAVIAADGLEALGCARAERPAAVVLDLVMPRLDGFGFLAQFRAEPAWARVPVLVWTVKDLAPAEHAALMRHAEAVLLKDGSGARALLPALQAWLPPVSSDPVAP